MRKPKGKDQYVKAVEYSHTLEKLLIMERENSAALRDKLEAAERERDELRLEIARIGGAKAIEVLRRDAAAGEPVAWQFYDDGSWHNGSNHNNHRENTEKAGYRIRELFPAAPPAVLPPEMKPEPEKYDVIDHGFIAGYNQCRADSLALGAQQQKVVELPAPEKDGGTDWQGDITAGCVNRMRDRCIAALDSANVKWEAKK